MKLKIELIPETAYGQNLRSVMKDSEWQSLSRFVRNKSNGICEICGRKFDSISQLDAHEVWTYKVKRKSLGKVMYIQRLKCIKAVCKKCHKTIHIGWTTHAGDKQYTKAVKHFMKVNKCGLLAFKKAEAKAYRKWRERSEHKWKLDINEKYLKTLSKEFVQNL